MRYLIIILGLVLANPVYANCDNLLKKWAIYHNGGKKAEAKKVLKKIYKECILVKK